MERFNKVGLTAALIVAGALYLHQPAAPQPTEPTTVPNPPTITADILIFTAKWCPACKRDVPSWVRKYEAAGNRVKVIDVDENPELATQHGITEVPTVIRLTETGEGTAISPSLLVTIYRGLKMLIAYLI